VHLIWRGHFRSRDKDGGHIQKPHATRKLHMIYGTGVIADGSFTLRE